MSDFKSNFSHIGFTLDENASGTIPLVKLRVFKLVAGLSLLMCVSTVALWVRCSQRFYTPQMLHVTDGPKGWEVILEKSRLLLLRKAQGPLVLRPPTLPKGSVWVGVSYADTYFQMPYWQLGTVFGILPVFWAVLTALRYGGQRNDTDGLCLTCGYDLRATPDRCPECGNVPEKLMEVHS